MNEETTITQKVTETTTDKPPANDSSVGGVSIRAWIAVILVLTICSTHLVVAVATMIDAVSKGDFGKVGTYTTVSEPLYSLVTLAVGFYFGQKVTKP